MSGTSASTARVAADLPWWPLLFPIGRTLGLFLVPVRVEGREHLPRSGGYMLVANHISWLDPPWIEFVIDRPVRYMAKRELFQVLVLGWLLRAVGVFPVTRHSADRGALATALEFLARGEIVGVFPEGHRSDDGTLIRAHAGVGYLARKSGALLVPAAISGSREAGFGRFWERAVTIRFGEPFRAAELDGGLDEQGLADAMMRRVAALLPPRQRGVYA